MKFYLCYQFYLLDIGSTFFSGWLQWLRLGEFHSDHSECGRLTGGSLSFLDSLKHPGGLTKFQHQDGYWMLDKKIAYAFCSTVTEVKNENPLRVS